ncbi:MAG TPA: PmoA family protein [Isosphaeraceae bacterium]|nr:PmoA family protein [Isosphaeraceae bacterium]
MRSKDDVDSHWPGDPAMLERLRLDFGLRLAALAVGLGTFEAQAAEPRRVTIRGVGIVLNETPVVVRLEARLPEGTYRLKPVGDKGHECYARVFEDGGTRQLALILDHLGADEVAEYVMEDTDGIRQRDRAVPQSPFAAVEFHEPRGDDVRIVAGLIPFATYHSKTGPKPFLFPLNGPGPEPVGVTRAYPMEKVEGEDHDHPHQRSLWFTHGNVNGIDFWSEQGRHGTIRETSRNVVSGPLIGVLRTTDDWLGPDGKKVLEDERTLRIFLTHKARVLDFDVTLRATVGPVTFGDTKEGTFGLRVVSSMDVDKKKGGKITNAEGLTDAAAWGKASPWVDYSGPVGDKTVGVAIFNHPSSFRAPTTWHVRTYGLFAANPFGWHDFGRKESGAYTLPRGESITLRYRILIHDGDAAAANLPAAFRAYANPPKIEFATEATEGTAKEKNE